RSLAAISPFRISPGLYLPDTISTPRSRAIVPCRRRERRRARALNFWDDFAASDAVGASLTRISGAAELFPLLVAMCRNLDARSTVRQLYASLVRNTSHWSI